MIDYDTYMVSASWKRRREACLRAARWSCARCSGAAVEVHHLTYERLGNERPADLQALCRPCHRAADDERAAATKRRVYGARLNGWATKVYGEDWAETGDPDATADEFDAWVDSKE